jgi:hypothetical protein
MIAPGVHNAFPFPIREASGTWDSVDYTVDQATVCGPGTRYPVAMTIQQMAQLYWRAKSFTLASSCAASLYGVAYYSTAFEDITWPTLVTPGANLEYYQIGQPEDTQQLYPGSQADNGVPWMVVVPVYQVFDGQPPMSISLPASGYFSAPGGEEGTMSEVAAAWMLRLFEYGALRSGSDYYPSIELTLMQPLLGDTCGSVGLRSLESAPP